MKKKVVGICKSIVVSTILSFVYFFVCVMPLNILGRGILGLDDINPLVFVFNMITYSMNFYFFRIRKLDDIVSTDGKFNMISESKKYFFNEGKYLLFIQCILAVLCEINYFLVSDDTGVFVAALCSMIFPFSSSFKIPVLRMVLSVLLAYVIALLLFEFYSYKIYKNKVRNKYQGD